MTHQRGQILPLALAMILAMAFLWALLINVGKLEKDRIQLQIAADTAAQSAGAIRARALSSIGRMNSWLGTPELGIGVPQAAWCPDCATLQKNFMTLIRNVQESYNKAYGGGRAAYLVRHVARQQGASDVYTPNGSYSLRLQINHGPIWYLSTRWIVLYGVPVPYPAWPQLWEENPTTRRWYEQGPGFSKKSMRLYAYRTARSPLNGRFPLGQQAFGIQMPDLYAVAAARVYNRGGPMFPRSNDTRGWGGGIAAMRAYRQASEHWQTQLVPVGRPYEH